MDNDGISADRTRWFKKNRVIIFLAAIFFLTGVVYGLWYGDSSHQMTLVVAKPLPEKINILVLGVDERGDDGGRSDTTFVVTVDTVAKRITMLSIPRDSRVRIAGHGWDKINHAYAFGGAKLSRTTIENLLGIPIDYTVMMNFQGFRRLIDAIGGVTITVDKRMYYSDPYDDDGGLFIDLQPGQQRMDGRTALEYVRYRDEEGDIGRVARQQKFLKALVQEFTRPQLMAKLPELIKEFAGVVKTDLPTREMVRLVPIAGEAVAAGLTAEFLAGEPIWIQDVSYWQPDIRDLRAKVARIQGMAMDYRYRQETERLAAEYLNSVPREFKVVTVPAAVPRSLESAVKPDGTGPKHTLPAKAKEENVPAPALKAAPPVNNPGPGTNITGPGGGAVTKNSPLTSGG